VIPKILHFIWVGYNPKPELVLRCIESWKKYCPDYEIKEWGNESLKEIDNAYVREAFEAKKWAFVSDYLRLYALKKYGGFYVDSDLEITQSLDAYLNNKFISGYENYEGHVLPITALMGAQKQSFIIDRLLKDYDDRHFILPDGSYDQTTNTVTISRFFEKEYGLKKPYDGTSKTLLGEDGFLEPYWVFCAPQNDKPNYGIHHFNGSWIDGYKRKSIFSCGKFTFAKFKKMKHTSTNVLPLKPNEKILWRFEKFYKKRIYVLLSKKD